MAKRILVVEDESIIRLDLTTILEDSGYEVIGEAGDGEKAVELALSLPLDLIIMDIKMPKLNGLKAAKIISQKKDTPIILLTAYSQKEFVDQSKEANVVAYLVKPVSKSNLIPAVEVALNQGEKLRGIQQAVTKAEENLKKRKTIEKAKGLLMKEKGLSEEEAYKRIRKISMDRHQSMINIANKIIAKYAQEAN